MNYYLSQKRTFKDTHFFENGKQTMKKSLSIDAFSFFSTLQIQKKLYFNKIKKKISS